MQSLKGKMTNTLDKSTETLIEEALKEFDERFVCIQGDCDGAGNIPYQVGDNEWEAEQCQFHAEYLFPMRELLEKHLSTIASKSADENNMVNNGKGTQPKLDRNRNLVADYLDNKPIAELATKYNISVPRIYKILRRFVKPSRQTKGIL